jgi:integrase
MFPNSEFTSSVTSISFKGNCFEPGIKPTALSRNTCKTTLNLTNQQENSLLNQSLTHTAEEYEKLLSVDTLKSLIKKMKIMYVEVRASNFRINKKIGKGIKPIRYTLNEPFSLRGLANVEKEVNKIKKMSKDELIEYKGSISEVTVEQIVSIYNDFDNKGYEQQTLKDYWHKCNTIIKHFGEISLKHFTHDAIQQWTLESKLSVGVIFKVLRHLRKVIRLALRREQMSLASYRSISFNDIRASVKQKRLVSVTKKTKLSEQEVKDVESLDVGLVKSEGLYPIWLAFQIHARNDGRRSGEMRCSAVEDIVTYKGQFKIELKRSCAIIGYKTTKIAKGVAHSVDIYQHTHEALAELIEDAKQYGPKEIEIYEKGILVKNETVQFLLVNPKTGEPYTEAEYRNDMKRLQLLAGIKEPITPRYLRHTFASLAKEAGVSDDVIAKQMTHCNDSNTKGHYFQLVHQDTTDEAKDFELKLARQMKNNTSKNHIKKWVEKATNLILLSFKNIKQQSRLKGQLNHLM